jgi:SP family sugar:H+ symporter-like MFS transporter
MIPLSYCTVSLSHWQRVTLGFPSQPLEDSLLCQREQDSALSLHVSDLPYSFQAQFGTYNAATGTTMMLAGRQTLMYGLEVSFITCGSLLAGLIATRYGRKSGLYFCAIASIAGLLTQMASNYTALVVGRSIMGVGIGLAAAFSIPYWSEIAPPRLRGVIVLLYQFSINISNFIGSCVDQGTHELMTTWAYRIPLLIVSVVAAEFTVTGDRCWS